MDYFVDTNILLRVLSPHATQTQQARQALRSLRRSNQRLCIFSQVVMEFWSVCTRPKPPQSNGLGFSTAVAERYVRFMEGFFTLLPDRPEIHTEWRRLTVTHEVTGRQVFDARLAASMLVHGVPQILTFNVADFQRYEGIDAIHPEDV